jgi:hypothetical protein
MMEQPTDVVTSIRCAGHCGFGGRLAAHHDRLLDVGDDAAAVLDLVELAVTWGELDYSDTGVIPPAMWLDFCSRHAWPDPEQAIRAFALATDVAMRSRQVSSA